MAHIHKHYSLLVAENVLRAANAIGFSALAHRRFSAECWDGCREQGYAITGLLVKGSTVRHAGVFVAQQRSSDGIVVVVDENIAGQGNQPSDEAWTYHRKDFRGSEVARAAQYVVTAIHGLLDRLHEEKKE